SSRGKRKNQVWDASAPLPLSRPFRWILENTPSGIFLRNIAGEVNQVNQQAAVKIDEGTIRNHVKIELPDRSVLQIRELRAVPPAYVPNPGALGSAKQPQLLAFSGVGRAVLTSQPVHSAYVAYVRKKPIFTVHYSADGYKIKPLLEGTRLKFQAQKSIPGLVGDPWKLDARQLQTCTVLWGTHWWRFNLISLDRLLEKSTRPREDGDAARSRKMVVGLGVIFALFTAALFLAPKQEKAIEEKPEAPVVHFIAPKKTKNALPKPVVAEKTMEAPAPAPAPVALEPPPAPKVANKKTPATPKKAAVPVPPRPAPPLPDPRIAQKKAADAKMKSLREALGGALNLTQKSVISKPAETGGTTSGLFNPNGAALAPTEIRSGYTAGNVKVGTLGGDGAKNGVGYGSGEHGAVSGQGKSYVSVDSGGPTVEEGLTKDEVGAVIHSHMDEIRYCHESAMLYSPNIEGKMVVQFAINRVGVVEMAAIQTSTLPEHGLEQCILKKMMHWKFPKPKGGTKVSVSYPFLFKTLGRE
ncbi:MAG: AgmX/PglI C-terminal domain-containing protein, partial [Bdellovibrionota bacterium]